MEEQPKTGICKNCKHEIEFKRWYYSCFHKDSNLGALCMERGCTCMDPEPIRDEVKQ